MAKSAAIDPPRVLVVSAFLISCGGNVASMSGDSPPACEGSPRVAGGSYWTLEEVPASLSAGCADSGPFVTIVASAELDSECLEPGPAYASRADTTYDVHVFAWRHRNSACQSAMKARSFTRPLRVEVTLGKSHRIVDRLSGSAVTLGIAAPASSCPAADGAQGSGSACTHDCDCLPGMVCVPEASGACSGTCGMPCGESTDCSIGACVLEPGAFVPVCEIGDCRPTGNVVCTQGRTCLCSTPPDSCVCRWDNVEPPARRACMVDADCPSPTECVEGRCGRECGIRCMTSAMQCPSGSLCADRPPPDRPWTCEVLE